MLTAPHQSTTHLRPVKVVFVDIDGTIVREGGSDVPEPVRHAVAAAVARGIKVVLCTGRSLVGVLPIAKSLGLDRRSVVIASNGAVTAELTGSRRHPFRVVRQRAFDPWAAFTMAMAVVPQVSMATEQVGIGWRVNRPFPADRLNGLQHIVDPRVLWFMRTTRAVVHAPGIANFAPQIEGAGFTATPAAEDWLDITARWLSKASEADSLRHWWGIHPEDTAAIGDGANDVRLLSQARYGFAMGNASQQVRDIADYVVGTLDQHGAADALDSLTLSTRIPVMTEAVAR